jgi:hypothetical protein
LIAVRAIFQNMASVEDTLNRFRYVIAEQTKALKELRAENERLAAVVAQSADAMTVLQAVYTDPTIKPEIRVAAAKAVLPHQRPKLSIQGYANVTSLAQRLDGAGQAKLIEHDPKSAA